MESSAVKVCYLDASALVKLVADDRDEELEETRFENTTTPTPT